MLDTMWAGAGGPPNPALLARNAYIAMIETAQNVADRYGLTREEIDAFALRSQQQCQGGPRLRATGQGDHAGDDPGDPEDAGRVFEHDEFIRDDTTAESLAKLPPNRAPPR